MNKTFLLNDFYSSHNLDFMFITESWIKVGDLTPFADLIPSDCTFFNFPRIVTILKNSLSARCRLVPVTAFSSFEAQLLHLDWNGPVCLGAIYRPLHSSKVFIQHFTELIGNIATNYDRFYWWAILISMSAVRQTPYHMTFLILLTLLIYLSGSMTLLIFRGHTLDFVLSYGLDVIDIVLSDFLISDHKPILFSLTLPDLSYFSTHL